MGKYLSNFVPRMLHFLLGHVYQTPLHTGSTDSVAIDPDILAYASFVVDTVFKPTLELCLAVISKHPHTAVAIQAAGCVHQVLDRHSPFYTLYEYDADKLRRQANEEQEHQKQVAPLFDLESDGNLFGSLSAGGGAKVGTGDFGFVPVDNSNNANETSYERAGAGAPAPQNKTTGSSNHSNIIAADDQTWRMGVKVGHEFLYRGKKVAVTQVGEEVDGHLFVEIDGVRPPVEIRNCQRHLRPVHVTSRSRHVTYVRAHGGSNLSDY